MHYLKLFGPLLLWSKGNCTYLQNLWAGLILTSFVDAHADQELQEGRKQTYPVTNIFCDNCCVHCAACLPQGLLDAAAVKEHVLFLGVSMIVTEYLGRKKGKNLEHQKKFPFFIIALQDYSSRINGLGFFGVCLFFFPVFSEYLMLWVMPGICVKFC